MWTILKKSYAASNKSRLAKLGSLLLLVITVEIIATVTIPIWRDFFYGGIEAKSVEIFHLGILYSVGIMFAFMFSQGFKVYAVQKLALEWRTALTHMLTNTWISVGATSVDNPDQRIAEDTQIASILALELVVEVIISFSIIAGLMLSMDTTLLYLSLIYTALATVIAAFFHRPLIDREKALQRAEADFRFRLATIVATGKTAPTGTLYDTVVRRTTHLIRVTLGFNLFSRAKSNLMNIIPLLMLVPMYFADEIGFGAIMKGISQFDLLVINATILIILYPKVTKALASYERIQEFHANITAPNTP